jgi:hypothetical protein
MPSIRLSRKNHNEGSSAEGHQLGPALGTQPVPNTGGQPTRNKPRAADALAVRRLPLVPPAWCLSSEGQSGKERP